MGSIPAIGRGVDTTPWPDDECVYGELQYCRYTKGPTLSPKIWVIVKREERHRRDGTKTETQGTCKLSPSAHASSS